MTYPKASAFRTAISVSSMALDDAIRRVRVYSLTIFTPTCFVGVHLSTMNPNLARYYNKLQTQPSNRKIPEKEGVMIEKVWPHFCTLSTITIAGMTRLIKRNQYSSTLF
jgi:hypothetical protein